MSDHDQRFKELLKRFISQFFQLFLPDWLPAFRFDAIAWLDKEYYPNPPQGKRPRLDLVGQVPLNDGFRVFADEHGPDHSEAIIHIEIESDDSSVPIRKRGYRYYNYLRDKHDLPVLPIVLHLNVGLDGIGRTVYKEGVQVIRKADETAEAAIIIADDQVEYRYRHVCLPGLPGAEYLERNEILGVALSALMRIPKADRPLHQAKAIKRIVESGESEYNRYLAAECVHAYIGLSEKEWAQTQELLRDPVYSGTITMITEVYRRTIAEANAKFQAEADAAAKENEAKLKAAEAKVKEAEAKVKEAADKAKEAENKAKEAENKAKEAENKAKEAFLQAQRAILTKLLKSKFSKEFETPIPAQIEAVDIDTLGHWFNYALLVDSWSKFVAITKWDNGEDNGRHNSNGHSNGRGGETPQD